jgi:phospholipase C
MSSAQIKNVFVLMLENRSFDHVLGFSGISGTDVVTGQTRPVNGPTGMSLQYQGTSYPIQSPGLNPMPLDPGHEFDDVLQELCGQGVTYAPPYPPVDIGRAGYISDYVQHMGSGGSGATLTDPLQCMSASQVPVICQLAESFVVCDGWFSSMPGPTWPNRFFVHAASSGGLDHSPTGTEIATWMLPMAFGYAFQNGTIFDRITKATKNVNAFRIYKGDSFPLTMFLSGMSTKYSFNFRPYTSFANDVQSSSYKTIPYTFIEPSYGNWLGDFTCGTSQHPLDDITRGEWLIKCTYEAIRNSPLWPTSLLVIVWDEHGGFYDHVVPPAATPPGDVDQQKGTNWSGFTFALCGPRVPAVIVSPLIPANLIDGRPYEHSSVPATLEAIFGLDPLTQRDRSAAALTRLISLGTPRTDTPTELVSPASGVTLPSCGPLTSCKAVPGAEEQQAILAAVAASPDADRPLVGNQPGFLYVALLQDLAVTPPIRHDERLARFEQVAFTRRDAAQYVLEVAERVRAAEAEAFPPA